MLSKSTPFSSSVATLLTVKDGFTSELILLPFNEEEDEDRSLDFCFAEAKSSEVSNTLVFCIC